MARTRHGQACPKPGSRAVARGTLGALPGHVHRRGGQAVESGKSLSALGATLICSHGFIIPLSLVYDNTVDIA